MAREINSTEVIIQPIVPKAVDDQQVIVYIPAANTGSYGAIKLETEDLNPDVIAENGILQLRNGRVLQIIEAKLNENIIKDPSKTYLVWKGDKFPNSSNATFKAPARCTIDWGDGKAETFETASTEVNTHTYTDGFEYHLISLSNYTVVDNNSFAYCSGLTSVIIGNGVTSISDNAFRDCDGLTSVIICNGVTSIGANAFFGCSVLTSVTIPNSVTSIDYQAFYNCSSLTSVTISDSMISITSSAFSGCSSLTSVTIGNSVTNIGSSAFDGCSSLTSITIPDRVKNIWDYAFSGCSRLKTIRISAINPPTLGSNAIDTSIEKIIVPKSSIDAYKSADGWSTYADKIVYEVDSSDLDIQALNIENGSGTKAIQQKQDGTTGTFDFTGKNPNATALDQTLTGKIPYGATGDFAVSFGGKSAAQGKRSVSAGTTTIAKGKYSAAFGDNSVALGNDSFTANYQNTSRGQASAAFGSETQSIGAASVTFGKGTITNNNYELACGRFNNSQSGYLFSVGCGSSDTDRRNALWVDGDITYCRSSNGDTGKIATLSDAENQANLVITKKFLNDDIQLSQNLNVIRSLKVGPDNIFTSAGSGVLFGHHLIASAYRQTVVGRYNSPSNNAFFQVGNGDDENTRKNAFEVWSDGRAKVQTAPIDNNDVVRKLELDTKLDKTGGTVTGDMVVGGNFTVQGKTTTVDSENLRVTDKLIEVGKGNTAPLTSPAGLITPKYDGTNNGGIVYDHTGTAYVGDITLDSNGNVDVNNSDLQPIATRNDTITNGNLVKWDGINHKLVDAGKNVENLGGVEVDNRTITKTPNEEIQAVALTNGTDLLTYAEILQATTIERL